LTVLERSGAAPDPCHEALSRQLPEVAAHGDLGNRKRPSKFRNLNEVAGLQHLEHALHAFFLRKTGYLARRLDGCDLTARPSGLSIALSK